MRLAPDCGARLGGGTVTAIVYALGVSERVVSRSTVVPGSNGGRPSQSLGVTLPLAEA